MAKEKPRYRAIKEYEKVFKKTYVSMIKNMTNQIFKKIKTYGNN